MKKRGDKLLLEDIVLAIEKIMEFIGGIDIETFKINDLLSSAVERKYEIIGEAASKLSDDVKQKTNMIPWHKLTAIRNIVIHGYFVVDLDILYNTGKKELPDLHRKLTELQRNIDL
jgi:uncharacterized protein with HEPN domain